MSAYGGFTSSPMGSELGVSLNASQAPSYSEVREMKLCEFCGIPFTRMRPLGIELGQKYCHRCDCKLSKPTEEAPRETPEDIAAANHSDAARRGAYKRWANYRANKALSPRIADEQRSGV